jgi:hypothetical protein
MSSSTKRPKPKSGQTAGRANAGQKEDAPQKTGATQPLSKPGAESNAKDAPAVTVKPASAANTKPASTAALSKTPQPAKKSPPPAFSNPRRDQKRDEISRKLEERRLQRERERRSRLLKRWLGFGGAALLVVGIIAFIVVKIVTSVPLPPYLTGATIDNIPCDQLEQTQVHYHAELQMYVNGVQQTFPSDAGRPATCFYWLHTHNPDGIIHVEAPADGTYNLGQFFDIWGQHLSTTQLLNNKVDSTHKLTIYVFNPTTDQLTNKDTNNPFTVSPPSNITPYTGDPRKIQIKPNEVIYVEYGTVVAPTPYSFAAGL